MKKLVNLGLIFFSVFLTLLVAEQVARYLDYLDKLSPPLARSWKEFRLSKPAPYKNAGYDIEKIINEAQQVGWQTDPNFGYMVNDFSGDYINTKNSYRKTPGRPVSPERRVWLFGGSTVICFEVPDDLTVPSYFNRLANAKYSNKLEIINVGATTVTIRHQLYRLRTSTDIRKGDIVIFLDGINDVIQTLFYQNPTGNMIQHNREQIESAGLSAKSLLLVYDKMSPSSAFVRRFLNPFTPPNRAVTISSDLSTRFEDDYFSAIMQADEYVRLKGGAFYHFLQPNLYTVSSLTAYEKKLLGNGYLHDKSLAEVYHQGYPRLQRASKRASKHGVQSFDISTTFDQRRSEIFLDFAHTNEVGNKILAQAILNKVDLLLPAIEP